MHWAMTTCDTVRAIMALLAAAFKASSDQPIGSYAGMLAGGTRVSTVELA